MTRYFPAFLPSAPTPTRSDLRHLGDFAVGRRVLVIAAVALPIGALAAALAWALLRLIGLITNAVLYDRLDTALLAPGAVHHWPLLILLAPVCGGLVIGLVARDVMSRAATVAGDRSAPMVFADDTLRHVAYLMAASEQTVLPVAERDQPERVVGTVGLEQLLAGRLRDLDEERHRSRVLRPLDLLGVGGGARQAEA